MASAWDELAKGFGKAVADIREKVVEEPWYGRVVNERDSAAPQWPEAKEPQPKEQAEPARDREQAQDRDMDR